MSLLELKNVTKRFGGLTAVGNINLNVEEGTIHGLIGPNGAGKTTIFNLITGVYKISEGQIHFNGERIDTEPTFKIAEKGITRTFQNIRLFKDLTTYQNILTACHFVSDYTLLDTVFYSKKFREGEKALHAIAEELMEIMNLSSRKDVTAKNLPYGYQRRLEIARAVVLKPKLLLLDEPAAGMNPDETMQLLEMIREIKQRFGLTVLIIEHHMDLIMNLCDQMMVLNFGKELAQGTPEEVQQNRVVIEAYLGEGGEDA